MPVPIQFKNASHDTIIVFNHTVNGQQKIVNPGFIPDTVIIDPKLQLISARNKVNIVTGNNSVPNSVIIYPNPIGDQFAIQLGNFSSNDISILLYNSAGQLIWKQQKQLLNGSDYITIDAHAWRKGIYMLSIRSGDFKYVKKLLK